MDDYYKDDYYRRLQVLREADFEAIQGAYKGLSKKYHPDTFKGEDKSSAEEEMKLINAAFDILSDPESRRIYDLKYFKNKGTGEGQNNNRSSEEPRASCNEHETYADIPYPNIARAVADAQQIRYSNPNQCVAKLGIATELMLDRILTNLNETIQINKVDNLRRLAECSCIDNEPLLSNIFHLLTYESITQRDDTMVEIMFDEMNNVKKWFIITDLKSKKAATNASESASSRSQGHYYANRNMSNTDTYREEDRPMELDWYYSVWCILPPTLFLPPLGIIIGLVIWGLRVKTVIQNRVLKKTSTAIIGVLLLVVISAFFDYIKS